MTPETLKKANELIERIGSLKGAMLLTSGHILLNRDSLIQQSSKQAVKAILQSDLQSQLDDAQKQLDQL